MTMKKAGLNQYTPLKRGKPLNRYSLERIAELQAETPVRIELCERAHGTPILRKVTIYRKGIGYPLVTVECSYGICQKCGHIKPLLDPHEEPFRSHGGKVSLKDSTMWCRDCQAMRHGKPMWSKNSKEGR